MALVTCVAPSLGGTLSGGAGNTCDHMLRIWPVNVVTFHPHLWVSRGRRHPPFGGSRNDKLQGFVSPETDRKPVRRPPWGSSLMPESALGSGKM